MDIKATLQCEPQLGSGPLPEPGNSSSRPRIPLKTDFNIVLLSPKSTAYKVSLLSK